MQPHVSLVTLGVEDLERARAFYRDGLGLPLSSVSNEDIAFFRTGGAVLAIFPYKSLAEDVGLSPEGEGFRRVSLAHNVAEREQVDEMLEEAVVVGTTLVKPAEDASWGGRSGYFADPDGHLWEVAWNPYFPFAADGTLELPE